MTLADGDFEFFRAWLQARSGLLLEPGKEYLVVARLEPLARRAGLPGVEALLQRLRQGAGDPLAAEVVESLTNHETSFFRDGRPFEALRLAVLPEAVHRRAVDRRLDLWCAGCASGQEPYSLAVLLADHFPELAAWDVRLHACDLSREMVARTGAGWFSALEVSRGLPAEALARHFRPQGGGYLASEALRARVLASQLNLAGPWPALPAMDAVLLRNVLLYLDLPTRQEILGRVHRLLRPGGALLLGAAETTLGLVTGFAPEEAGGGTWFRRV